MKVILETKQFIKLQEFVGSDMTPSTTKTPQNLGGNSEVTTNDNIVNPEETEIPTTTDDYANNMYRRDILNTPQIRRQTKIIENTVDINTTQQQQQTTTQKNTQSNQIPSLEQVVNSSIITKMETMMPLINQIKTNQKATAAILNYFIDTLAPTVTNSNFRKIMREKLM